MNKKLFKYGIIIIIGIIMIYQFLPIGDYCSGLLNLFNYLFYMGLLLVIVIILAIRNLIRVIKTKEKFDFIPLLLVLFFGVLWYFLLDHSNKKFWTETTLIGFAEVEGTPKSGTLKLYKNGTFGATYHRADYSCTYQDNYKIIENRLLLNRSGLNQLTDNVFTTEYIINRKDSILKPLKEGFIDIRISKIIE